MESGKWLIGITIGAVLRAYPKQELALQYPEIPLVAVQSVNRLARLITWTAAIAAWIASVFSMNCRHCAHKSRGLNE